MPNDQRNRKNQPPTGRGKGTPRHGDESKLEKRSEVAQAQRHHPELNLGDDRAEAGWIGDTYRPKKKAGR